MQRVESLRQQSIDPRENEIKAAFPDSPPERGLLRGLYSSGARRGADDRCLSSAHRSKPAGHEKRWLAPQLICCKYE